MFKQVQPIVFMYSESSERFSHIPKMSYLTYDMLEVLELDSNT